MAFPRDHAQAGFTLVEILVALALFSIVSVGFYTAVFMTQRNTTVVRDAASTSQEVRLGFLRLVRDTREAQSIRALGPNSFRIEVDFNYDGVVQPYPGVNGQGDIEDLLYEYDAATGTVRLHDEVLMSGVACVPNGASGCAADVFSYTSNRLEYDWNSDGVTTCLELDASATHGVVGVGDADGVCDTPEWRYISNVGFAMQVSSGGSTEVFRSQAQLRNQR